MSHQPSARRPATPLHLMSSRLTFALCQPSPLLKPASGLPSSFPCLFFPCVPSPHIINTPQPSPSLHPHSTPLEPLTSKACQLNMSLIRAGGACSPGLGGAGGGEGGGGQLSITTGESHTPSDNQRKSSDLINLSFLACCGLLLYSF